MLNEGKQPAPGDDNRGSRLGTTSWLVVRLPRLVLTIAAVFVALFAIMPWVHIDRVWR